MTRRRRRAGRLAAALLLAGAGRALAAAPVQVRGPASMLTVVEARGDGPLRTVRVTEEATAPAYEGVIGGRSLAAVLDLDCQAAAVRVQSLTVHAEHGLKGAVAAEVGPGAGWRRPGEGTVSARALRGGCIGYGAGSKGKAGSRPLLAAPAVAAASPDGGTPAAAEPLAPAPRRFVAQLASTPSEPEARKLAARASGLPVGAGLKVEVTPSAGGGRPVYRVRVTGFAGRAPADAFCADIKARGRGCLVVTSGG